MLSGSYAEGSSLNQGVVRGRSGETIVSRCKRNHRRGCLGIFRLDALFVPTPRLRHPSYQLRNSPTTQAVGHAVHQSDACESLLENAINDLSRKTNERQPRLSGPVRKKSKPTNWNFSTGVPVGRLFAFESAVLQAWIGQSKKPTRPQPEEEEPRK